MSASLWLLQGKRQGSKSLPENFEKLRSFLSEETRRLHSAGSSASSSKKPGVAIQPVSEGAVHLNPFFDTRNSPTVMGVFCSSGCGETSDAFPVVKALDAWMAKKKHLCWVYNAEEFAEICKDPDSPMSSIPHKWDPQRRSA